MFKAFDLEQDKLRVIYPDIGRVYYVCTIVYKQPESYYLIQVCEWWCTLKTIRSSVNGEATRSSPW
jgi:hypothetical protein